MPFQNATSVKVANGDPAKLALQYGAILDAVYASFMHTRLLNTNYINEPVRGGTVQVRKLHKAVSQALGTARTAGEGTDLKNTVIDVKIDTDREFSEELSNKDYKLWEGNGDTAILGQRINAYALGLGAYLETAYFAELATVASVVDATGLTTIESKLEKLIRTVEATTGELFEGIDRSMLILTLNPETYDALEGKLVESNSLLTGRTDARYFRRVEVVPALKQTEDAICQMVGAVAQPLLLGDFRTDVPNFSNARFTYMDWFTGLKAISPEAVAKIAIAPVESA